MESINQIQDQIIEDFSMFEDWNDKYEYIIESGKALKPLDEQYKNEENIIKGCQSKVWLIAYMKDDNLYFEADSDAIITKGIISLLVRVYSGHKPKEIYENDLYFINNIGLKEHLSPNRANGLISMVKQMKMYAFSYDQVK